MVLASSLNETGKKTFLLANICRKMGATQYVYPIGSAEYLLAELAVMNEAKIETLFHNYIHPQYEQRFPPFLPFASAVDLILNEGDRSMEIIRSGRHILLTPDQVSARITEVNKA